MTLAGPGHARKQRACPRLVPGSGKKSGERAGRSPLALLNQPAFGFAAAVAVSAFLSIFALRISSSV